jgi:hypothetical protein
VRGAENTPPPSPGEVGGFRIDTEGINDDIVVGVIEQLEKTGNRPHLLKELAAVLQNTIPIVERYENGGLARHLKRYANHNHSSANQSAIISSRLSTYLRRPWTALSPCPVGKELIGTHPKRIYFYLTTQPHQPFPEPIESQSPANRIISPSLTSAENEEEEEHISRSRSEMSPSPEVDLTSPELDDGDSHMSTSGSFSGGHIMLHTSSHETVRGSMAHGRASPPLERDEREFTQTASSLQRRRKSESREIKAEDIPALAPPTIDEPMIEADESEERAAQRNEEAAAALFGHTHGALSISRVPFMESSPMLRPQMDIDATLSSKQTPPATHAVHDMQWSEDMVQSLLMCEPVELDELDDLFQSY